MLVADTARPPQSHQKASTYHNVQGVLGGAVLLHFLQTTNLTLVSADTPPAACCSVQQAYVTVLLNPVPGSSAQTQASRARLSNSGQDPTAAGHFTVYGEQA